MRKKARLMVTLKCGRNCPYCVNKDTKLMAQARRIQNVSCLKDYDEVIITGGEPLLEEKKTLRVLLDLRRQNSKQVLYLYSSIWTPGMMPALASVDGLTYTMHQNPTDEDIRDLQVFQLAVLGLGKSFRLSVSPDIKIGLCISPAVWKSIKVKHWYPVGECPLPDGEELFILEQ